MCHVQCLFIMHIDLDLDLDLDLELSKHLTEINKIGYRNRSFKSSKGCEFGEFEEIKALKVLEYGRNSQKLLCWCCYQNIMINVQSRSIIVTDKKNTWLDQGKDGLH